MSREQEGDDNKFGNVSPSSSPPTPPSPLPLSFGPGNQKYSFSASSTPSPPFTPPLSTNNSAEKLPLVGKSQEVPVSASTPKPSPPSAFSVDLKYPNQQEDESSCLIDLFEWILRRCCNCCTKNRITQDPENVASPGFV